jgi:hypothetical protein
MYIAEKSYSIGWRLTFLMDGKFYFSLYDSYYYNNGVLFFRVQMFYLCKYFLTLVRMTIKTCVAVWLGVMYDSQALNRKQGGLPVTASLPPQLHSYWSPQVIYDSQPARMHTNTAPKRWKLLLFY